tara:strand:- start:905 stop:1468 length:564 start_codon:yes stop_codon:yes gene_type:complete
MKINNKIFLIASLYIIFSCTVNNDFQVIDYRKDVQIEDLEKIFQRVIGSGTLSGKGKSNFTSSFIFESNNNSSMIVFKDFLGRRNYMIEVNNDEIRYLNVRKKIEISESEFNKFFPLSNMVDSNFYKHILWGDPKILNEMNIKLENAYIVSTKLISIDGSNYLNEIVFSLNNEKQTYSMQFNKRNFK